MQVVECRNLEGFALVDQKRLREYVTYDPETGRFFWAISKRGWLRKNAQAGWVGNGGYVYIILDGRRYRAHRIAWLWTYGSWPEQIDHINGEWNENFNPIELDNNWLAQLGVNPIRRRWYKRKFKYVHRLQNHFTNKFLNQ